ncbi:formate dehydrogenase accessory sulfurtransferase FdhD [Bradyrhizobium vignae]|uniref:formate dehydrogenase accessory sulfurtransferase FdhD n=1 Tax=Bradyrhizobium vignae TaxID=1549949 RepID=UPI00100A561F|nr:formate dehydrogenase accessory sulfurtransferase FdhD [Bradyrhizobium vignae]RXG86207.1 formate dehydrogenase accessory sulfurtransferase FdhD [Bradyrhizobium vignae]
MVDHPLERRAKLVWRGGAPSLSFRLVAEERAIALTFGGSTNAVMMATPADLEDFGIGFALTEGIIARVNEIASIEVIESDFGIEVRMWLESDRADELLARRRAMTGPAGCGLCGIESLEQACLAPPRVSDEATFYARDLLEAMSALPALQELNQKTRAVHAAGFWRPGSGIDLVREDVGRHNALDKLAGALIRKNVCGADGAILLTSRVSVEMVQKTARLGAPVLVAVSAPTLLAIQAADQAGVTLVAVARADGFEIFTHPDRLIFSDRRIIAA